MTMGSRFKVSKWRVCKVFFLVRSLNKFLREVDTVTKSAGGAAVRCPETCTGTARQRRGFDRADDDMRVRSDVLSCIYSLSQLFKGWREDRHIVKGATVLTNYTDFSL